MQNPTVNTLGVMLKVQGVNEGDYHQEDERLFREQSINILMAHYQSSNSVKAGSK